MFFGDLFFSFSLSTYCYCVSILSKSKKKKKTHNHHHQSFFLSYVQAAALHYIAMHQPPRNPRVSPRYKKLTPHKTSPDRHRKTHLGSGLAFDPPRHHNHHPGREAHARGRRLLGELHASAALLALFAECESVSCAHRTFFFPSIPVCRFR